MSDFGNPGTFWYVWGLVFLFAFTAIILLGIITAIVRAYKNKKNIAKMIPDMEEVFDWQGFVEFCYEIMPSETLIRNAEKEYEEADKRTRDLVEKMNQTGSVSVADELKDARRDMLIKHFRLKSLKAGERDVMDASANIIEKISADGQQIRAMRGVQQIYMDGNKLCIYVRATYPYGDKLYDLGDYRIKYSRDARFVVNVVRGGSFYAVYDGKDLNFCVGRHECEVKRYLSAGRIVEATVLIIDSLHHINAGERNDIPNEYKPICKLTRKEKRELKIKLKY